MMKPRRTLAACASAGVLALALAAPLPAAADARPRDGKRVDAPRAPEGARARWLKVRVYENGATTPTVLVNLPLRAVTVVARLLAAAGALGGRVTIDAGGEPIRIHDLDLDELLRELEHADGQIVEVKEGGERVSIWIE